MPQVSNEAQLQKIMEEAANKALNKVTVRVLQKLKEQIRQDVYTEKNSWYERTGEFEDAWLWSDVTKKVNALVVELSYDPKNMRYTPKDWIHGNPRESAVNNLADILNLAFNNYKAGYTSNLKFGDKHFSHFRRPYWNNFIERLFDKGELDRIITEEFSKHGFIKV